MDFQTLSELIKTDLAKALPILKLKQKEDIEDFKKEYKGSRDLRITQVGKRQNKTVGKENTKKSIPVAKIPVNFQKKIVRSAVSFLLGSPVKLVSENEEALQLVKDVWNDNRLDNILKKACETVKSETEAVLFFFTDTVKVDGKDKSVIKIRLYNSENGTYAPYFDEFGDMKAFTWWFDSLDKNNKKVENVWVFTEEFTFKYIKYGGDWNLEEQPKNMYGKIPVVYLSQEEPEWNVVKELIDQNEMTLSKFVDTNAYFAEPIVKLYGTVKSMPNKEDQGKAIRIPQKFVDGKLVESGDAKYLTWDNAPEAIKLENDITTNHIYSITDTPDLSFNNVKGISVTSGIALKLMFLGAILKAKWDEGDYNIAISRIINLIVAGISNISSISDKGKFKDFKTSITFTSILPDNLVETITTLSEAVGGKPIMSQETAMSHNPLVEDATVELKNMKNEETSNIGSTTM